MKISLGQLTSKSQVTVPAWVRKKLGIETKTKIVWLELKPGEISVIAKKALGKNAIDQLCGVLKGKGIDQINLVDNLLVDRKKDLELEEKGFINKK